jgi:hypothetical protein
LIGGLEVVLGLALLLAGTQGLITKEPLFKILADSTEKE